MKYYQRFHESVLLLNNCSARVTTGILHLPHGLEGRWGGGRGAVTHTHHNLDSKNERQNRKLWTYEAAEHGAGQASCEAHVEDRQDCVRMPRSPRSSSTSRAPRASITILHPASPTAACSKTPPSLPRCSRRQTPERFPLLKTYYTPVSVSHTRPPPLPLQRGEGEHGGAWRQPLLHRSEESIQRVQPISWAPAEHTAGIPADVPSQMKREHEEGLRGETAGETGRRRWMLSSTLHKRPGLPL